jgi:glycosyltransferase involved in cell wall biosynthesis
MSSVKFSVIIPTLQRSPGLRPLVKQCLAHPLVDEVIVINNSPAPLGMEDPRLRLFDQSENIYVNPAWNLGAAEARAELLAIVNDDVQFDDEALTHAAEILRKGRYGIVAPDKSCLWADASRPVSHRLASRDNLIFGTFMCMRKSDYVPIPDELRIWGGDHWLYWNQRRPSAVLIRTPFRTEMSTTSSDPEFEALRATEAEAVTRIMRNVRGRRWWHHPTAVLELARTTRARLRRQLDR